METEVNSNNRDIDGEFVDLEPFLNCLPKQAPGARCVYIPSLPRESQHDRNFLDGYFEVASFLLPRMRHGGLLYRLINRERFNLNIVLVLGTIVLGGTTISCVRFQDTLVFNVIAIAVDQKVHTCGKGHGTRLVNAIKSFARIVFEEVSKQEGLSSLLLLTQSDGGDQACNFWKKQRFFETEEARQIVDGLHANNPRRHKLYDGAKCMACDITYSAETIRPGKSTRAQDHIAMVEDMSNLNCKCKRQTLEVDVRLVAVCKQRKIWVGIG
mmetsp:Transcript_20422/g.52375  ORF Transcript_20422/g.52375 Transcript_20422/m.52375 type:complete len:269 (+) Transcript_20422:227-1033(+)